jgi:hypothetical protein
MVYRPDPFAAVLVLAGVLLGVAFVVRVIAPAPEDLPPSPSGPEVGYT